MQMQRKVTSSKLLLTLTVYTLSWKLSTCLIPALVISFTQTRGEESSARQTVSGPKPGQAPKNEEEEGFPGKVSWRLPLCHGGQGRFGSPLCWGTCALFLNCPSFSRTGWCLRALCASFVPSTRRRWKHTWTVAFIRTTSSSFQGSCPSRPQTSYRWNS